MATIETLHKSISAMSRQEVFDLIRGIRDIRRTRPAPKKVAPAKTKRRPSKKAPRQQDLFALADGMTSAQKAKLFAQLTGVSK